MTNSPTFPSNHGVDNLAADAIHSGSSTATNNASAGRSASAITEPNGITARDAALVYASLGWRVLAVKYQDKVPIGKWRDEATTDADVLSRVFANGPLNIAIAPSNDNGLVIIDVDVKEDADGFASLAHLEARLGPLPRSMTVRTGSGGEHIYTKVSDPAVYARIRNTVGAIAKGIDVRACGGYVVAPPSVHPNGQPYVWKTTSTSLPELPSLWAETLAAPSSSPPAQVVPAVASPACDYRAMDALVQKIVQRVANAPRGARNDTLLRTAFAVGGLIGSGCVDHHTAESHLVQAAMSAGLFMDGEERKSRDTIRRGLVAGAARPWAPSRGTSAGVSQGARPANDNGMVQDDHIMSINVDESEPRVVDLAVSALAAHPGVFAAHGLLVVLQTHEKAVGAFTKALDVWKLTDTLGRAARWYRPKVSNGMESEEPAKVPDRIAKQVRSLGTWDGVPVLNGIVGGPRLRRDGTVIEGGGFDLLSGLYVDDEVSLGELPPLTEASVATARASLYDILGEFAFDTDVDRSAWIAALLTVLARDCIQGSCPMFLFDGSGPGVGKGTAVNAIGWIASGRAPAVMPPPTAPEETRKVITSIVMAGREIAVFDNVVKRFASPEIAQVVTADVHEDRILGTNSSIRARVRTVWMATGNNLTVSNEIARRAIRCRLVARTEDVVGRCFKVPDLQNQVLARRPELLRACFVLLRFHLTNPSDAPSLPTFASFGGWSSVVRAAMVRAGIDDPMEAFRKMERESDDETPALAALLEWIHRKMEGRSRGLTSHEIAAQLGPEGDIRSLLQGEWDEDSSDASEGLVALVHQQLGPTARVDAVNTGTVLARYRDRIAGGRCLEATRSGRRRAWRIKLIDR